jgi:hypothetical protein
MLVVRLALVSSVRTGLGHLFLQFSLHRWPAREPEGEDCKSEHFTSLIIYGCSLRFIGHSAVRIDGLEYGEILLENSKHLIL